MSWYGRSEFSLKPMLKIRQGSNLLVFVALRSKLSFILASFLTLAERVGFKSGGVKGALQPLILVIPTFFLKPLKASVSVFITLAQSTFVTSLINFVRPISWRTGICVGLPELRTPVSFSQYLDQKDLRNVVCVINALSLSMVNRMILNVPSVDVIGQARIRITEHSAKEI
jgi:hypothetical protein